MSDEGADRPPDDPPGGARGEGGVGGGEGVDGEEDGDAGAGPDGGGTDPNGDGTGPGDEDDYDPSLAGVFGARPGDEPPRKELVPETPSLENALFLLLGVLLGGFVIYRAVTIFTA